MPTEEKAGKLSKFKLFGRKNKKQQQQTSEVVLPADDSSQTPNAESAPSPAFSNRRSRIFNPFKSVRKAVTGIRQKSKSVQQEECKKNLDVPQEVTETPRDDSKTVLSQTDIQNLDVLQNEVVIVEDMRKNRPKGPPGRKRRPTRPSNGRSVASPKITGDAIDNRVEEEDGVKGLENGVHEPPPTSPGNVSAQTSSSSSNKHVLVLSSDSVDNVVKDENSEDHPSTNRIKDDTSNAPTNANTVIVTEKPGGDVVVDPDLCRTSLGGASQKDDNSSNRNNLSQLG